MKRVLVVKTSSLGDVVHALPAVTDACRHGCEVDWVVEEAFADIPRMHPGVRQVIPVAWRRWRRSLIGSASEMRAFARTLREQPYDCVIDSQGLIKSAALALIARGPRDGFSHTSAREPWAAFTYRRRHRIPREQHAIDRQRALFSAALGYPLDDGQSILPARGGREGPAVFLHGTTWATKHWPEPMWVALAELVAGEGFDVVLPWGSPDEKERAERIAAQGPAKVLPAMGLAELGELLKEAALVVGVDSGLTHLSAALSVPTVGIYGPTSIDLTGCRGEQATALQSSLACSPCLDQRCRNYTGAPQHFHGEVVTPPCFADIEPDRVWMTARAILSGKEPREGQI